MLGGGRVLSLVRLPGTLETDMSPLHISELVLALFVAGWMSWVIAAEGRPLRYDIWYALRDTYRALFRYPKRKANQYNWFELTYKYRKIWYHLEHPYDKTRQVVGNLIYYAPFIWKDSWFDHSFLLDMIERKCTRDAKYYRSRAMAASADTTADELEKIATICHKLSNEFEEYEEPLYDAHDLKWGKNKDWLNRHSRPNATTPELQQQQHDEFIQIMKDYEKAKQCDCVLLGLLFMHCRSWWD